MINYKRKLTLTIAAGAILMATACNHPQQPTVVYQTPPTVVQQPAVAYVAPPANVVYATSNPCDAIYYDPILCRRALGFGGYYNSLGVYMAISALHDWAYYNNQETYYVHSHPGFRPTVVIVNHPPARVQAWGVNGSRTVNVAPVVRPATSYNGSAYKQQPGSYNGSAYKQQPGSGGKFYAFAPVPANRSTATIRSTPSYTPRPSTSFSSGRRFGK